MSSLEGFPKGSSVEQPEEQNAENVVGDQPVHQETEARETSVEEGVDAALESQNNAVSRRESGHDKKALSGLGRWAVTALAMGVSFLGIGCSAEKPSVEKPEPPKAEKSQDGFTDDAHENVQRRVKLKKAEIERMRENSRSRR